MNVGEPRPQAGRGSLGDSCNNAAGRRPGSGLEQERGERELRSMKEVIPAN